MRIKLRDEEYVELEYRGFVFKVGITNLEPDDQYPEIDISLPYELAVNCWARNLTKASPLSEDNQHVRIACDLCIPIDVELEENVA